MAAVSVVPMKGGDGPYSYFHNSSFQREGIQQALVLIKESILEKLDLVQVIAPNSSSSSKLFTVADLGCSVGPNTIIAVENIIEFVKLKHQSIPSNQEHDLEFQVFFNDLVSNDFNTLFKSLPPERQYFAAATPGSFWGRLFPKASLQFVHSSYTLHWLSTIPKELVDENSPAFNKGRISFNNSPREVGEAFSAQFAKDTESFLSARAEELVGGGLMAVVMVCIPDDVPYSQTVSFVIADIFEACLLDMVREEKLGEDKVDSFNMPRYHPTPREMEELIRRNGCFIIERMEELVRTENPMGKAAFANTQGMVSHLRAAWEGIIKEHFGAQVADEVFDRYLKKITMSSSALQPLSQNYKPLYEMFLLLKRNII